jgi:SPP1 family predicted phage head-tail adaptor
MMEREVKFKSFASEAQHRVSVQVKNPTADGEGGFRESWSDVYTNISAAIIPIRAQKVFELRSVNVDATHFVKLNGYITITELHRIKYGSRIFEVLTVEDLQERDFIKWVTCKERR